MNLTNIAQLLGSQCLTNNKDITGVCIDSRQVLPGNLFIAIAGERFDGHDFCKEAAAKGALAIVCQKLDKTISIPQLVVKDTIEALATIAKEFRQRITCPIIALTGSNGKTTVKEMIAAILPPPSHATPGNLNNHIGAPLSVLQLKPQHRYAVFELGANHPGEIAYTAAIVKPHVTLINNIAPAHIEGFGSIEGVARTKGEIYQGMENGGTAIINDDDDYAHFWDDVLANKKILRFSRLKPAHIHATNIQLDENGCARFELILPNGRQGQIKLQVPGEHAVSNALAATACCYAAGIPFASIIDGLNRFRGVAGRMTFLKGKNEAVIIDDTYNANLRSVLTAVNVLAKRKGLRILVLGDMGELGDWTQQHHEEIGLAAQKQGIDLLMTCGIHSEHSSKAFGALAKHYKNQEELARDLLDKLNADTTILVKGSRSAAMEKIVRQLVG